MADPDVNRPEWDLDSSEPPVRGARCALAPEQAPQSSASRCMRSTPEERSLPTTPITQMKSYSWSSTGDRNCGPPTVAAACNPATRSPFHAARSARTGSATPTVGPRACSSSPR
jgi:hypothetical protein